jgi:hypothetical protein
MSSVANLISINCTPQACIYCVCMHVQMFVYVLEKEGSAQGIQDNIGI